MAWIVSFLVMISVAVLFTSLLMLVAAHSRKSTALFIEAAKGLKVCRVCTTLALAHQDRCPDCRSVTWGYVPQSLVREIDLEALKNSPEPAKLAGYRSADWPPRDPIARSEEMQSIPDKDPDSAAMLASVCAMVGIWGVGHIYVGKVIIGIVLMFTGAVTWGSFVLLIFIGKGPVFWFLGLITWSLLIFVCYPDDSKDPIRGRGFILPGLAISSTVFTLWSRVEVTYIFMALSITIWVFLTTRAYNLAVEYNESRERKGISLW